MQLVLGKLVLWAVEQVAGVLSAVGSSAAVGGFWSSDPGWLDKLLLFLFPAPYEYLAA